MDQKDFIKERYKAIGRKGGLTISIKRGKAYMTTFSKKGCEPVARRPKKLCTPKFGEPIRVRLSN